MLWCGAKVGVAQRNVIHDQTGLTTVFVTHDQDEAMELADIVVVMSMGRIEQIGTPKEIRTRPATRFVADFVTA